MSKIQVVYGPDLEPVGVTVFSSSQWEILTQRGYIVLMGFPPPSHVRDPIDSNHMRELTSPVRLKLHRLVIGDSVGERAHSFMVVADNADAASRLPQTLLPAQVPVWS